MRPVRVLATMVCLGWTCVWLASTPVDVPHPAPAATAVTRPVPATTTTTTVPPPIVAVALPPKPQEDPPGARIRASRGSAHRSPPEIAQEAPTAPAEVDLYGPRNYRDATPDEHAEAHALICSYDWPCEQAWSIALCESAGRWWIMNRSGSSATGIFQIMHGPRVLDQNVDGAHRMWESRGFQPWNASRRCWS